MGEEITRDIAKAIDVFNNDDCFSVFSNSYFRYESLIGHHVIVFNCLRDIRLQQFPKDHRRKAVVVMEEDLCLSSSLALDERFCQINVLNIRLNTLYLTSVMEIHVFVISLWCVVFMLCVFHVRLFLKFGLFRRHKRDLNSPRIVKKMRSKILIFGL